MDGLNERQRRIVGLIDCGADVAIIAGELGVSHWTILDQIRRMRRKLGAKSLGDLPRAARAAGYDLPPCLDEWVDADDPDAEDDEEKLLVPADEDDDGRIRVDDLPPCDGEE